MDEVEKLKKQIALLEKQLSEKDKIIKDPSKRGYYALNKIVYQQIEFLESFNLKESIGANPKEDKGYDRAKGIWEGMKTMIMDIRSLKTELKIAPDEEAKEVNKIYRITPESISDVLGNTAGHQS